MVKRRLNEDISPAEKMIVHKFYDDIIERNEKILKIFKKIKFDDKEELFTYESSSKIPIPEQFKRLYHAYEILDKRLGEIIRLHRSIVKDLTEDKFDYNDVLSLKALVGDLNNFNTMYRKEAAKNAKKFFTKRKVQTAAKHMINVYKNLEGLTRDLKADRDMLYSLYKNFDNIFEFNIKDVSNVEIRDTITKTIGNIRTELVRMSKDEGNFIIKVAKQKGLDVKID